MKVLLLSENSKISEKIEDFCEKENLFFISYKLALKAMDNIAEIDPDFLIINSIDFPRHWKIMVQHLHSQVGKGLKKTLLIIDDSFSENDRQKAHILNVDEFLLLKDFNDDLQKIKSVLKRTEIFHKTFDKKIVNNEKNFEKIEFSIENGFTKKNIKGKISNLSSESVQIKLNSENECNGMPIGQVLSNAIIKIGNETFKPNCCIKEFYNNIASFELCWHSKIEKKFFSKCVKSI